MTSNTRRVPVYRQAGPCRALSESDPSLYDGEIEGDQLAYFSEPCSPERGLLRDDAIPLEEIKDIIRRVQAKHDKRKKEKSRKNENKKKKQKETMERIQSWKEDANNLLSVVELEEEEMKKMPTTQYWSSLKQRVMSYMIRERELIVQVRDRVLIRNQDAATKSSIQASLMQLRDDIATDEDFNAALRSMHVNRVELALGLTRC
ncbi:hypothetical protein L249_7855 [Ophiocordyceps polyrhachis-furcata BCC 54312]|uniref:Uncharacterized protein n=1 Tax=Ophiocordyceps polyrhachis-furcata BCC 54312 TaxID=1330021 RepID=A0A367L0K6_9HYPO|nr:hypothetical protein L249_7855 [Ophiocordyceps polyrhachis-furcata BCC 54312]